MVHAQARASLSCSQVAAPVFLRSTPAPGLDTQGWATGPDAWSVPIMVLCPLFFLVLLLSTLSIWSQCFRDMVANNTCCVPLCLGLGTGFVSLYDNIEQCNIIFIDMKTEDLGGVRVRLFAAGRAQIQT